MPVSCHLCKLVHLKGHGETLCPCMQQMLQFDEAQQAALFILRRQYVTDLAFNTRRRQLVMQQLQNIPEASGTDMTGLGAVHVSVLDLTQELQKCAEEEFALFRDYMTVLAYEVMACWTCCFNRCRDPCT